MPPKAFHNTPARKNAPPSFEHFDHLSMTPAAANSTFNTGFREWLRKITSPSSDAGLLACEQIRIEQVKKLIGELLGSLVSGMSARDLRLYLRIMSTSQLASIREVRFECFDLMCRKISEPVAVRKLQELDALIR